MTTITTTDGTHIFYKDWGPKDGQPIIFSHGWPLSADAWDAQMVFFANQGFRTIAHDRRSHGRSDQVWDNNNMDQYADDLAELIEQLDLKDVILVGHSTGGGEVTRYIGRHGTSRVSKAVLIGAIPPLMLKTPAGYALHANPSRRNVGFSPQIDASFADFYALVEKREQHLQPVAERLTGIVGRSQSRGCAVVRSIRRLGWTAGRAL